GARLRQREGDFRVRQYRRDEAAVALRRYDIAGADIGTLANPERPDVRRITLGCRDQSIAVRAVERNDRGAVRLQTLEDLGLRIRGRFLVGEERAMRRRNGGDDRNMRA